MKPYTKEEMKYLESGLIMLAKYGSHAYGLARPDSDLDIRGIYIGPRNHVYGIQRREQYDKFEKDDITIYEFRKFVKLASECNPNIIELLYLDEYIYKDKFFDILLENRDLFLSKRAAKKFLSYAQAQLIRIKNHKKWINNPQSEFPPRQKDFTRKIYEEIGDKTRFVTIFNKEEYKGAHKKWKEYWHWKKNRNPERAILEEKYGYDTKHAMHLLRLLHMMMEILVNKEVIVNRKKAGDVELLLNIRMGKYSYDEVMKFANSIIEVSDNLINTSSLRSSVDLKRIENLMINIYEEFWKQEKNRKNIDEIIRGIQ